MFRPTLLATLLCSVGSFGVTAASSLQHEDFITSKTTYQPQQHWESYAQPPQGYRIAMVQHLARHGSRGLSSPDDDDLLLQLWHRAREEGALTPLGEALGPEIKRLTAVQQRIGYGELSTLGRQEHAEMATRMVQRHAELFKAPGSRPIVVSHSGRSRAAQSGEAFVAQMLHEVPALKHITEPAYASPATVYFNEESEAYEDYKDNDPRLLAAMEQILTAPRSVQVINDVLLRLFNADFVQRLHDGEFLFIATDEEEDDTLSTPWEAVEALYGLYTVAPNLRADATLNFSPFLPDEDAQWLAYIDDADSFYGRGPGFAGDDITYRAADALFAEIMAQIQQLRTDPDTAVLASLRFSHAQATMPIATWLQLENTQYPVTEDELYSYDTNPWRAAEISPMGANIQWDIYVRDTGGSNNGADILVRMLHNEKEVPFAKECKPIASTQYFYTFNELNRCFSVIHGL